MVEVIVALVTGLIAGGFIGSTLGANNKRNAVDAITDYYEGVVADLEDAYDDLKAKANKKKAKPAA